MFPNLKYRDSWIYLLHYPPCLSLSNMFFLQLQKVRYFQVVGKKHEEACENHSAEGGLCRLREYFLGALLMRCD